MPEAPVTTMAPPPPPPTTPEPFLNALSLGTSYRYGREDIAIEVSVYKVKVMDSYEWLSPRWGRYWDTTPKAGNKFLFAFD
jgi:hypothetical protein